MLSSTTIRMKFISRHGNFFRHCILTMLLFHSIARAQGLCDDPDSWDCDNGECIASEKLCDGTKECKDGSDESVMNCISYNCPSYAFRCAYGGCVSGQSRCNGVKDCDDNSDEILMLCGTDFDRENIELKLHGNCSESSFQCTSSQCIDNDLTCDGRLDCDDGSDETTELCSANTCPPYSFQCGYGACINGAAICDGVPDCADSSDEAWSRCKTERKRPKPRPTQPPVVKDDRCVIFADRTNLLTQNLGERTTLLPGNSVPFDTYVIFSCQSEYRLIGKEFNLCLNSGWKEDLPFCTKSCNTSEIQGYSTKTNCYIDYAVNCKSTLVPGTQVSMSCSESYREPKNFRKTIKCSENGKWNLNRIPCEVECGRIVSETTAFVALGDVVETTEVPWHVGIYSKIVENEVKYTCGGSLISPTIVLSAAHCFWDEANDVEYEPSLFIVVAGKYYRDFHKNRNNEHRERAVKKIFIRDFQHRSNYFKNDLAVVILAEYLRFKNIIAPVCHHLDTQLEVNTVNSNENGKFAGWGFTEDRAASDELRQAGIKTLSHADCADYMKRRDLRYTLPETHFCLYNSHGVSACRGDSGGGFVIERRDQRGKPYYQLLGVISHSPEKDENCALNGVVTVTQISKLKNFIKHYIQLELNNE